jgi:hypothetical protein
MFNQTSGHQYTKDLYKAFLAIHGWLDKHRQTMRDELSFYQHDWQVVKGATAHQIKMILALSLAC